VELLPVLPANEQPAAAGAGTGITDHDHPPALPVPAARREPGIVEDPEDDLVGDRIWTTLPGAADGAHNRTEFHCHIMSAMSRARSLTAWARWKWPGI